ncbi:MAG: UTP--glucose-1-phosphate uridylyltransferase [Candidatus Cloacimonetes bacterium]|nr:UTP--glucose-1-phosphate uridylyltransferase [Candidatus Cloacimonadota bacterium]
MNASFTKLMKQEGLCNEVIRTFAAYYADLAKGEKGYISANEINPPSSANLIQYDQIKHKSSERLLANTVVIKLNGGLGTSMGLSKAKSLLPVKGNMNFLDIISRQILTLRAKTGYDVLLMFMNSFSTEEDTLKYLQKYPELGKQGLPISFVQNKFPRIRQDNLLPYESQDKAAMWNPPGHGDLYTAISSGGLLEALIQHGYRYAFVSNADNLGATVDTCIPAYMEENNIPFIMEVCHRTSMDKKGGHLSEDKGGQLLLREIAQCPEAEVEQFQDVDYYKYFNTNNLWIDLKALEWQIISNEGLMLLPLIVNPKIVEGTPVYQLETAMGSAISIFPNAKALVVSRERFAPVKKTNDLLTIWSDAYELNDQYQIVLKRGLDKAPQIVLDETYYGKIADLQQRFPTGAPSLNGCRELIVSGDVTFLDYIICEGNVNLTATKPVSLRNQLLTGIMNLDG